MLQIGGNDSILSVKGILWLAYKIGLLSHPTPKVIGSALDYIFISTYSTITFSAQNSPVHSKGSRLCVWRVTYLSNKCLVKEILPPFLMEIGDISEWWNKA